MIIVIDNYDSFTYNLVHYIGEYEQNIKVVRNDEMKVSDILALNPSKIVISPGPCTPKEAGVSVELIKLSTSTNSWSMSWTPINWGCIWWEYC
jgi:anthranilate/para-aminobenzoate synthase component II